MSEKRPTAGEQSTMGLYLRELRRIPQLSREEEQAFAARAAQGDRKARQHLIQANLRFVILVAKRYRNRGVPMEDLVNEGNIGLIRAAERFDPDRGVRFVSYAVWWIRQAIRKAIHEDGRLIRLPRSRAEELPSTTELRMQVAQKTLSLDSPVPGTEDSGSLGACLEDRSVLKPEEVMVGASLKDELGSVLAGLSDREASILQDRFGLASSKRITLLEVALVRARDAEEAMQRLERAWSDWPEELLGRHLCHTADAPAESATGVGRTLIRPVGAA